MPTPSRSDIDAFASHTRSQLDLLARDFMQPLEVRRRARQARTRIVRQELRAAIGNFDKATQEFVGITRDLLEITEEARKDPVGDAVGLLTPIIRRAGDLFTGIGEMETESARKTSDGTPAAPEPAPDPEFVPGSVAGSAPPPGTAANSRDYDTIAREYLATFAAANPDPSRTSIIERMRQRLVGHRNEYESVGRPMAIPWHFVGLIHAMESAFNFGTHLHNGDSLAHRTRNVPRNRPATPDPPFAWTTSAIDALQHHNLQLVGEWPLSRQLYELERYNGFGYRFRGLATPYLWSFSDRYQKGKFVRDGVFDANAVSGQAGAAVLLKALISAQDIPAPEAA